MTNTITFTSTTTATASKSFLKKAMIYGTDEYKILRSFRLENPEVKVVAREIKKHEGKDSYKNLTYANMESYMNNLDNGAELIAEFNRQKEMACIAKNKYRYMLNWFRSACFESEAEFAAYRADMRTAEVAA